MNNQALLSKFCIIGLGTHCKKNIIPALVNTDKQIVGVVTSQKSIDILENKLIFSNISDAIKNLSEETVFVLCNPPKYHENDILKLVNANRHIYVEKPAFVKKINISNIEKKCAEKKLIFVELFMYKYTKLYKKFLKIWNKNLYSIVSLYINFNIPSVPSNTFRSNNGIFDTALYDIGCYPFSLLFDLGINMDNMTIESSTYHNPNYQKFLIFDVNSNVKIHVNFGVGGEYENFIKIKLKNNKHIIFQPFFYGKDVNKTIEEYDSNNTFPTTSKKFTDNNGFEKLFTKGKDYWYLSQRDRFENINRVTDILSKISLQLKKNSYLKLE